jgi:hypothetical protein
VHRNPGKQELAMVWFLGAKRERLDLGFHQKPGRDEGNEEFEGFYVSTLFSPHSPQRTHSFNRPENMRYIMKFHAGPAFGNAG